MNKHFWNSLRVGGKVSDLSGRVYTVANVVPPPPGDNGFNRVYFNNCPISGFPHQVLKRVA